MWFVPSILIADIRGKAGNVVVRKKRERLPKGLPKEYLRWTKMSQMYIAIYWERKLAGEHEFDTFELRCKIRDLIQTEARSMGWPAPNRPGTERAILALAYRIGKAMRAMPAVGHLGGGGPGPMNIWALFDKLARLGGVGPQAIMLASLKGTNGPNDLKPLFPKNRLALYNPSPTATVASTPTLRWNPAWCTPSQDLVVHYLVQHPTGDWDVDYHVLDTHEVDVLAGTCELPGLPQGKTIALDICFVDWQLKHCSGSVLQIIQT